MLVAQSPTRFLIWLLLREVVVRWLLVFTFSGGLFAQDAGVVTGTISDSTGASIADATVKLGNAERGIDRNTVSNSVGAYVLGGLPPGAYKLTITATGFRTYTASFVLRVAERIRADATLQLPTANTAINVQGNITHVETQASDLAGTLTRKEITQLQLNGRNFTQLIALVPGVSNLGQQDEGAVGVLNFLNFSINGGRTEYNNWEVDGGDIMDNGSNATLNVYPSIDAIAEVRILVSNYGAQYGRNGSGTIEVETKSGTNRFHGNVYEFVRNDMFNARNYFDPPGPAPAYKKNDFGYTLGGPIYIPGFYNVNKDRTFFFWSQEWRIEHIPAPFSLPVPSLAERLGNFNDICPSSDCPHDPTTGKPFPNNTVSVDPNAKAILTMIPEPNSGTFLFNTSSIQPTNWREELLRIDHNLTPKLRASFRWIHDSWDTVTPTTWDAWANFPTIQTKQKTPGVSMVARLTASASPSLLNEFVFSYTTNHLKFTDIGAWRRPPTMTLKGLFENGFGGKLPGVQVSGNAVYNGGFAEDPGIFPWLNSNPTYTLRDQVTKSIGNHYLQSGAYAVAAQKNELSFSEVQGFLTFDTGSKVSTGNAFADLLVGRIAEFTQANVQPKYYNRYKFVEPYFQDDWRVNKRLTLNLGLRVSLFGTYRDRYRMAFNFDPRSYDPASAPKIDLDGTITGRAGALIPGSGNRFDGLVQCGVDGVPAGCMSPHLFNPAPRLGFAWDPKGAGKTAIRGAYGIFFEHTNGNEANTESLEGSAPVALTSTQFNIKGYDQVGGGGLFFPLQTTAIQTRAIWPYVQQWHVDVQRQLIKDTVATLSYVGTKGTHLALQRDFNQLHPAPLSLNPFEPHQPLSSEVCDTGIVNGIVLSGQAANNLSVACGNNPDPLRPFVGYSTIALLENQASSSYNSFQSSIRRTAGPLMLNVAYTLSHSIDNSSDRGDAPFVDAYNLKATRASSNFDQRHILNFSWIYDFPPFRNRGFVHTLARGWQFSGIGTFQTGIPFSIINGGPFSDNAGVGNQLGPQSYPDVIGNPYAVPAVKTVEGVPGPLLYNPNAFAAPRGLTFGNASRNLLRNPKRVNFDMAISRHLQLREHSEFEFRAEAFNIFNHTQWSGINNTIGCFGGPNNSAGDPSCNDNGFLHPGGAHLSRILQFALKLIF